MAGDLEITGRLAQVRRVASGEGECRATYPTASVEFKAVKAKSSEYVWHVRKKVLALTQTEFGELIGKSELTIRRYESGRFPVPLVVIMAIEKLEADHSQGKK